MENKVQSLMAQSPEGQVIFDRYQRAEAAEVLFDAHDLFDAKLTAFALCWVESRLGSQDLARFCWESVAGVTVTDQLWRMITSGAALGPICSKVREIAIAYNVYSLE